MAKLLHVRVVMIKRLRAIVVFNKTRRNLFF